MLVLAPSLKALQKLLSLCEQFCQEWDIKLNAKKSKCLFFGKGQTPKYKLKLDNEEIDWVDKWVYLGVTLLSGPVFGCCVAETISKFYRAANAILRVDGRSDDMIMLRLLETHCVSLLSYAVEIVHVVDSKEESSE